MPSNTSCARTKQNRKGSLVLGFHPVFFVCLIPMSATITSESIPNRFDFAEAQSRLFDFWDKAGYFQADVNSDKQPYSIVIPPPNVTGALHLGHALNNTLQDIV